MRPEYAVAACVIPTVFLITRIPDFFEYKNRNSDGTNIDAVKYALNKPFGIFERFSERRREIMERHIPKKYRNNKEN